MRKYNSTIEKKTAFDYFIYVFYVFILIVIIYPLYFIIIASISEPSLINMGEVWIIPRKITLAGYKEIFTFGTLWNGYKNSLIYTLLGTSINLVITLTGGYVLSRKDLPGKSFLMVVLIVPMYFSGGLVPTYLLVNSLGIMDTIWAMVLPTAMDVLYVIVARTFFQTTIPDELLESAALDGCTDFRFFVSIVLPLSKAIIAVLAIYYAVGHWNSYFQALIYLRDKTLAPLQIVLREILIVNSTNNETFQLNLLTNTDEMDRQALAQLIKYGTIVVSSAPLLIVYPFFQKYFLQGVMLGAIKG